MKRIFVGIEIPRHLRDRLALLRGNLPGARWVDPGDYHLTLRFLGDCDGQTLTSVIANLDRIDQAPFILQPGEPGTFGHEKTRAIWIGVMDNPALTVLREHVEQAARSAGRPPDGRKFTPHITLARLGRGRAARRGSNAVANALGAIGGPLIAPFTVDRFILYSSSRTGGGGPYAIEEEFPLDWQQREHSK